MTIALELVADMNERQWQAYVEGLLRFYGWRHFHAPDNRPIAGRGGRAGKQHVEPGFPDLVAIRRLRGHGAELLFAELKTETGRLSKAQRDWRAELAGFIAGVRASGKFAAEFVEVHRLPAIAFYVWRPSDANELEAILAGPHGIGVPVDRVADLEDGDVVDEGAQELDAAVAELEAGAAAAIAQLEGEGGERNGLAQLDP